MSELIVLQHPNGYFGSLTVGKEMTITKDGEEVLHTYSPTPKSTDELWEVLETMPEFLKMVKDGESDEEVRD